MEAGSRYKDSEDVKHVQSVVSTAHQASDDCTGRELTGECYSPCESNTVLFAFTKPTPRNPVNKRPVREERHQNGDDSICNGEPRENLSAVGTGPIDFTRRNDPFEWYWRKRGRVQACIHAEIRRDG